MAAHSEVSVKRTPPWRAVAGTVAILLMALPAGGCIRTSPRFKEPFALSNPNERYPILVRQGEVAIDLAVYRGADGLSPTQRVKLGSFLTDYRRQGADRLLIRAPSGAQNEGATMHAMEDVRSALRAAGISSRTVMLEPYYANGDPGAPLHISYLRAVAQAPECGDWSEDLARDPQNMPWPNMGCSAQANLAAMVDNPNDFIEPRTETARPGERRDVVWGKYVAGERTGAKWTRRDHANASEVSRVDE